MGNLGWGALVGWATLHGFIVLAGTWLARRYALRHHLIDEPGDRRSHATATPRGGGVAIVVALLVAAGWCSVIEPSRTTLLMSFALGLAAVAGVGWLDDHRPLSPWWRLVVHALAALLLGWGMWQDSGDAGAVMLAIILSMVLVNIWNFMDGIDALATSQAMLVALGYALLAATGVELLLALALAGACAGFLPWNLPKARIFLGDVGSGALGYAVAALATLLAQRDWSLAPALLLPLTAFLIDALLTLATRMARGARWWLPHTEHAYQQWTQRIRRHGVVTAAYAIWTVISTVLMLAAYQAGPAFIIMALSAGCLIGAAMWSRLRQSPRRTAQGNTQ